MTSSKVKPGAKFFATDPAAVAGGAVTSWFSFAHPLSVVTGSGYSNVHDVLNPSSPMTQSTNGLRPPNATSANGLPIVTTSVAHMPIPLIAARQNDTTWGYFAWVKPQTTADNLCSIGTSSGSSINRQYTFFAGSGTGFRFRVFDGAGASRFADLTAAFTVNAWHFLTVEYNGNRTGDARAIMTVNGSVVTAGYSTGSGLNLMPATLQTATGTGSFFAFGFGGPFFIGSVGTNFGFFGSAMAGASEGLLTQQARLALMNFQRPT